MQMGREAGFTWTEFSWQTAHCPRDSTSALLAAAPSGAQNLSPRALLPGTA